jgi:hypothetical protein
MLAGILVINGCGQAVDNSQEGEASVVEMIGDGPLHLHMIEHGLAMPTAIPDAFPLRAGRSSRPNTASGCALRRG